MSAAAWFPIRPCVSAAAAAHIRSPALVGTGRLTLHHRRNGSRNKSTLAGSLGRVSLPHTLSQRWKQQRTLLTLAIETSCDDTCVAILDKSENAVAGADKVDSRCPQARLLFDKKVTSDNRGYGGVHPIAAVVSHTAHLGPLVKEALGHLPLAKEPAPMPLAGGADDGEAAAWWRRHLWVDGTLRRKPDFVSVTRGPGMMSNLASGLNTAKGLALAWDVPLLGVNHMQAHALTPRLVSALEDGMETERSEQPDHESAFPFFSLLVSGGHTLLVQSRGLTDHSILASASNIAIGDMIDKCARAIIPASLMNQTENVMYGALLERFAFPERDYANQDPVYDLGYDYGYEPPARRADEIEVFDSGRGWTLTPPLSLSGTGQRAMTYDFAGINGQVQRLVEHDVPDMGLEDRRLLARHVMRLAFEHLVSRLIFALNKDTDEKRKLAKTSQSPDHAATTTTTTSSGSEDTTLDAGAVSTVVVAGGVASNRYLQHVLRRMLEARGFGHLRVVAPPPPLCTDNAAMIAWTGMEMWEAGWRSQMDILALRKWPVDPAAPGGGILGAEGWVNVNQ
jgi:N6-L-threonylcarbamoyladenine synthase